MWAVAADVAPEMDLMTKATKAKRCPAALWLRSSTYLHVVAVSSTADIPVFPSNSGQWRWRSSNDAPTMTIRHWLSHLSYTSHFITWLDSESSICSTMRTDSYTIEHCVYRSCLHMQYYIIQCMLHSPPLHTEIVWILVRCTIVNM